MKEFDILFVEEMFHLLIGGTAHGLTPRQVLDESDPAPGELEIFTLGPLLETGLVLVPQELQIGRAHV